MTAAEDLAQLVHLEQVAVLPVEPEPPDRESGVVGQLQDISGIVQTLHQVTLQQKIGAFYFMGTYVWVLLIPIEEEETDRYKYP